ncbi:Phosphotransferase involved in threonylcarbamoyladenosine t(6)A37 formation in tRNA [hydrothermal vent metagenome]|uniref:Phosphotransferase involved in threonylcarbamoyladenosine t(6)A37 formation in tRNA n=1 Tax=hydrothermal vent metagenome TaxID=652676 RepID=A0A3B1A0K1_9ZZZZ
MDLREKEITVWLEKELGLTQIELTPASSDASFRRYFRCLNNDKTVIVMDAPPQHEDCQPFIDIAKAMRELGLNVPEVHLIDLERGYLLLSDLGSVQYLEQLNAQTATKLYADALAALKRLQFRGSQELLLLPDYDTNLLQREMELFREWFVTQQLNCELSDNDNHIMDEAFSLLTESALTQPRVWVHRDYHSRNLMVTAENNPGILDFQDAVYGPVTYDLVSLLRDCYIDWPQSQVESWVADYYLQIKEELLGNDVDRVLFQKWFDWMGAQRHLKAIGIFSRLNIRDGKAGYLADIPRTFSYLVEVTSAYPELAELNHLLQQRIKPLIKNETQ